MKAFIRTAAFAVITVVSATNAFAINSLPECYDKVIAACNKGDHAQSCANSGMNQCDKVFPTPMVFKPGLGLSAATQQTRPPVQSTTAVAPR